MWLIDVCFLILKCYSCILITIDIVYFVLPANLYEYYWLTKVTYTCFKTMPFLGYQYVSFYNPNRTVLFLIIVVPGFFFLFVILTNIILANGMLSMF